MSLLRSGFERRYAMVILHTRERRMLTHIIENLLVNEEAQYKVITEAGLCRFLPQPGVEFKSPYKATKDLVNQIEYFGDLPERPSYRALGALLSSLLERHNLPPDHAS